MASNSYTTQVNNVAVVPNGSNDGQTGPITRMRHASFISLWFQGPSNKVELAGVTSLNGRQTSEGFDLLPSAGTFSLEPKMGIRKFNVTWTRMTPRGNTVLDALRSAYAISAGSISGADIRPDMLPVTLVVAYQLVGPGYNYGAPIDSFQDVYGTLFVQDITFNYVENPNGFMTETCTGMGAFSAFSGSQFAYVTAPYMTNYGKYSSS